MTNGIRTDGGQDYVDPDNPVVTIVEPSAAMEPGEATGTIESWEIKTYDGQNNFQEVDSPSDADEPVQYFKMDISVEGSDDFTISESWSLNKGRLSENTGLGDILRRFGVDLQALRDQEVNLDDVFFRGRGVRFVAEEEEGEDDEEGSGFMRIQEGSLEPLNVEETPDAVQVDGEVQTSSEQETESGGGEDDEDVQEVLAIVEQHEGESETDVKKAIAQENGNLVKVFNQMKGEELEVSDGVVLIA